MSAQWCVDHQILQSRLLLGTAQYPSPDVLQQAVKIAEVDIITAALRRQAPSKKAGQSFWNYLQNMGKKILPNTAGCHSAREAITTAQMAREIFQTHWIKLEVIEDDYLQKPHAQELLAAARELIQQDFFVWPYCTEDMALCEALVEIGCQVLMPWAAPIGSAQGFLQLEALRKLRTRFPQQTLIVDAGIGAPSQTACAMEIGFDAVLLNSAVALAQYPIAMAAAFRDAVRAGRAAYDAGLLPPRSLARPSTPLIDRPFGAQKSPESS